MNLLTTLTRSIASLSSPHPLRDWLLTLALAVMLTAVFLSVSVYYFFGVRSGALVSGTDTALEKPARLSKGDLEKAVALYEARRAAYESGDIAVPQVSDLSR